MIQMTFEDFNRVVARHRWSEGFCQCDQQPWPCDFHLMLNYFCSDNHREAT